MGHQSCAVTLCVLPYEGKVPLEGFCSAQPWCCRGTAPTSPQAYRSRVRAGTWLGAQERCVWSQSSGAVQREEMQEQLSGPYGMFLQLICTAIKVARHWATKRCTSTAKNHHLAVRSLPSMDNEVSHCSCPSHLPCSTFFLSGHSRLMPSASALIITCMERVTLLDTTKLPLTPNLWGTRVLVWPVRFSFSISLPVWPDKCTHARTHTQIRIALLTCFLPIQTSPSSISKATGQPNFQRGPLIWAAAFHIQVPYPAAPCCFTACQQMRRKKRSKPSSAICCWCTITANTQRH